MKASAQIAGLLLTAVVTAAAQQNPQSSARSAAAGTSSSKQRTQQTKPATSAPGLQAPSTTAPSGSTTQAPKTGGTSLSKPALNANWKQYCAPEGDYCVKYPTTWAPLGDTEDSSGLVIAPTQTSKPASLWSNVTVAATDLPQPPTGKERPSFDDLIAVVLDSMRPGVDAQTLERRAMTIDDMPAQFLKLQYEEEGHAWIEEIVLVDAEDVVYTMALRCTPEEVASLEPVFKEIVGTWRMVENQ